MNASGYFSYLRLYGNATALTGNINSEAPLSFTIFSIVIPENGLAIVNAEYEMPSVKAKLYLTYHY